MAKGKYMEWITPDGLLTLEGWARDGLTDKEIAKKIGVSVGTFYNWEKQFFEFLEAIKKGRRPVVVEVENNFFETKLKGYYVDEEVTEKTVHKDASGAIVGTTEHKRITKRYIAPDTTAMIFYLKCHKKDVYNDKIVVKTENENGQLAELIEGLKDNVYTKTVAANGTMADEQA